MMELMRAKQSFIAIFTLWQEEREMLQILEGNKKYYSINK